MLSKMLNLTYNEILKQLKKRSVQIIIGLILIFAIILPMIIKTSEVKQYDKYDIQNFDIRLENSNEEINKLKLDKTEKGKVLRNNIEIEKKSVELSKEGKVGYYSWRKNEVENYREIYSKILVIKEILNNTNKKVLLENAREINPLDIEEYSKLSKEQLKKELSILEKDLDESKQIVLKEDYLKYLENNTSKSEKIINENRKLVKDLNEQLIKEPNNDQVKKEIDYLTKKINKQEEFLNIDKYRLSNKINFEKNNWKNNALKNIKSNMQELNSPLLTKDEFDQNASKLNLKMTYEEYKEDYEQKSKELKDSINIEWYSLKNDKPQLQDIEDARTVLNTASNQYIILTILTLIIIGGGIVSTEFSKGTIRLLLIRPVSRAKIMFSKLLALLTIGYGILISAILISVISSGIIFGFKTLTIPILKVASGKVIEISFIQYLSQNILLISASLIFIMSFVFMISAISKNTAIAVALSMILYLGAMPLTTILLTMNIKWIFNTFLPYISQPFFNLMPSFMEMLKSQNGIKLNPYVGAIQLFIISIILIGIAISTFIKRDV